MLKESVVYRPLRVLSVTPKGGSAPGPPLNFQSVVKPTLTFTHATRVHFQKLLKCVHAPVRGKLRGAGKLPENRFGASTGIRTESRKGSGLVQMLDRLQQRPGGSTIGPRPDRIEDFLENSCALFVVHLSYLTESIAWALLAILRLDPSTLGEQLVAKTSANAIRAQC